MWPRSFLLLFLLFAVNCAATRPSWFPTSSCEEVWRARLPGGGAQYDYRADARPTEQGNEGYAGYAARVQRQHCHKDWTLLVYMAAANDLAPYAYLNLSEMEAGDETGAPPTGSAPRSDVLVQLNTATSPTGRRLHIFQTPDPVDSSYAAANPGMRRERDIRSPIVALTPRPQPTPQAAAADLEHFLRWGIREYPALHYMVVIWGHGEGWAPSQAQAVRVAGLGREALAGKQLGGIALDAQLGTFLDMPALHRVLHSVEGELLQGRPVDVYVSDACLMQTLEVATELSDTARFIVGSTQVQAYYGLPYRDLVREINRGRPAVPADQSGLDEGEQLARRIPQLFGQSFAAGGVRAGLLPELRKTFTMSALSTAALEATLLPALLDLARALEAYLREQPLHAADLRFVLQSGSSYLGGYRDVGAFLDATRELLEQQNQPPEKRSPATQQLLTALESTAQALRRTVVSFAHGSDYTDARGQLRDPDFRAVSVWLPASERDYQHRIDHFSTSRYYNLSAADLPSTSPWRRWLEYTFQPAAAVAPALAP